MKESYIKPTAKVIKIQTKGLVMTSLTVDPSQETSTQLSRDNGFLWDEDEDDDPMGAPSFDVWEE